jgi:hypothetical protein
MSGNTARFMLASLVLVCLPWTPLRPADSPRPAVFFHGGAHLEYVLRPLVAMGIEVDVGDDLAGKLATGDYNVAVVHRLNGGERAAVERFMGEGGGVFQTYPTGSASLYTRETRSPAIHSRRAPPVTTAQPSDPRDAHRSRASVIARGVPVASSPPLQ